MFSSEENKVKLVATAGKFIVHENSGYSSDAEMFGYQGAVNWSTKRLGTQEPVDFTIATSYYDTYDVLGAATVNNTGVSFLRTNTVRAGEFRMLDIYPEIQFQVGKKPLTLWANSIVNLGNVGTDDDRALGNDIHDANDAWGLGFKLGKAKKKGEWEISYGYYEIGANAVLAAFNDSDFGGPGGNGFTNRKGHKLGLAYQLTNNLAINWTGIFVEPLNPSTLVANSSNENVFRSQTDLSFKF